MKNSNKILPEVNTDEEYENFKLNNSELFHKIALQIATQHHLSDEMLSPFEAQGVTSRLPLLT
jgi:hypothetical protein